MSLFGNLFGSSYEQQLADYKQQEKDFEELEGLQHRRAIGAAMAPHFDAMRAQQSPEQGVQTSAIQEMLKHAGLYDQGVKSLGDLSKQRTGLWTGQDKRDYEIANPKPTAEQSNIRAWLNYNEDEKKAAIERAAATRPLTKIDMGGNRQAVMPMGKDQRDAFGIPDTDKRQWVVGKDNVPKPLDVKKITSGETIGKWAMLNTALQGMDEAESFMFNKDLAGNIDYTNPNMKNIRDAFITEKDPTSAVGKLSKLITSKEGQQLASLQEKGFQAITRIETGAAMPPEEIENTKSRFQPGPLDSHEEILEKWRAYKFFISSAVHMIDPNISDPARATAAINSAVDYAFANYSKDDAKAPETANIDMYKRGNPVPGIEGAVFD